MRVLHFAPRVCWPLDTGAKLRNYHLARVLSRRAQVTLLAFGDEDDALPPESSENFYDQIVAVKRAAGYTLSKILRGALGRTPLSLLNYTTDAMRQSLGNILNERSFDIVQVESIHLMAYLPAIRAARGRPLVICDWHNIESELMQRYSERERSFLRQKYARRTARQLSVLEQRASHDFDAHVTVSDRDRQQLLQLNPAAKAFVIENGVDSAGRPGFSSWVRWTTTLTSVGSLILLARSGPVFTIRGLNSSSQSSAAIPRLKFASSDQSRVLKSPAPLTMCARIIAKPSRRSFRSKLAAAVA